MVASLGPAGQGKIRPTVDDTEVDGMEQEDKTILTRRMAEFGVALATLVFGIVVMAGAVENDIGWGDLGPSAGTFPFYVGAVVVLASIGVLGQTLLMRREAAVTLLTRGQFKRIAAFFLPIVGYVVLVMVLGLYVASALYLFAVMLWQGRYGVVLSLVVSLGSTAAFFVMFEWCFQMPLLKGPLEAWLGIY